MSLTLSQILNCPILAVALRHQVDRRVLVEGLRVSDGHLSDPLGEANPGMAVLALR
jgi:hypothetical protein